MTRKSPDDTLRQRLPSVDPTKAKNAVVSFAQLRRGVELQSLKVTGAECLDFRAPTPTDSGPLGVKSALRFGRVSLCTDVGAARVNAWRMMGDPAASKSTRAQVRNGAPQG